MGFNDCRLNKGKAEDYWVYLEDNYKEVSSWPSWMRGEASASSEDTESKLDANGAEAEPDSGKADLQL